jgi:hypothetical protein
MTMIRSLLAALALVAANASSPAGAGEDHRHVVRAGETLLGIATDMLKKPEYWRRLQRINRIADPYRLLPGTVLYIPIALMRTEPATAKVTAMSGEASADGKALKVGDTIAGRSRIATGEQGFVTVELIDGSRLVLQPGSRLQIEELARYRNTQLPETKLRLEAGRIESAITRSAAPRPKYRIDTPTAAIGVRGTSFRVGADAVASRTEVTDGKVGVQGSGAAVEVAEGYGVVAAADGRLSAPAALLPGPDVAGLPVLHERPIVRFALPPLAGAQSYRFQVGTDVEMRDLLADTVAAKPEAKFGHLPDGEYTLRVRGIDARGLEGRDADFRFKLKARPEPPFATAPINNLKLRAEAVALAWTTNPDAARYRIQVAADASFGPLFADIDGVEGNTVMPAQKLPPGDYVWRVRSIRADGDVGPWGDAQPFRMRALPAAPEPPRIDDKALSFAWPGEPGQTFLFQVARDAGFTDLVAERQLNEPTVGIERPAPATYYMRVRATDADGFVGPFTTPQIVEVPYPPPPWWLPLLLLLPLGL